MAYLPAHDPDDTRRALLGVSVVLALIIIGDFVWSARRIQRLGVIRDPKSFYVHVQLNERDGRPVDGKMASVTTWKTRREWSPDDRLEMPLNSQQAAVLRTLLPRLHNIQKCGDGWFTEGLLRISKTDSEPESWRFECVREPIETLSLVIVRVVLGVPLLIIVLTLLSVPFLDNVQNPPPLEVTAPVALLLVIVMTFIDFQIVQRWWEIPFGQSLTTKTLDDIMFVKWTAHHGFRCGTHDYEAVLSNAQGFGLFCQRLLEMQQTVKAQSIGIDWGVHPQKAPGQAKNPAGAAEGAPAVAGGQASEPGAAERQAAATARSPEVAALVALASGRPTRLIPQIEAA